MIAAILRAQLQSMRRGGVALSLITGFFFYGFWLMLAAGLSFFFADPDGTPNFVTALSSGLLFAMLYWQLAPVLTASFGASIDLKKLRAYPIPFRTLFLIEILLRITACSEMPILLLGVVVGLMRNPQFPPSTWPVIILGALLFTATNILLSAGTRNLFERIFLRSRLKEVMMVLLVSVGLIPQILLFMHVRSATVLRLVPSNVAWPWAAVARLMLHNDFGLSASIAVTYLSLAFAWGRWQFTRSMNFDDSSSGPATASASSSESFSLPAWFLRDPIAALVEKELRTLIRIPRCRLVFFMSCFFGLFVQRPFMRSGASRYSLPLMGVYGLLMLGQITYWNAFGFDREGAQGYFSWPVKFRDALIAKNITVALLLIPQAALIVSIVFFGRIVVSPALIVEGVIVTAIAALYWIGMGNIVSVRMPRPMDPLKMNQMSNKLQAMSIFIAPFLLLPIYLAYWALHVFERDWVLYALLTLAAIIGVIIYSLGLDSAVTYANRQRELFVTRLSRSEGPFSLS
jgi:hypothetical protein